MKFIQRFVADKSTQTRFDSLKGLSKKIFIFSFVGALALAGCQKKEGTTVLSFKSNLEIPIIRKDKSFPEGVLQFTSRTTFKAFFDKSSEDRSYARSVTGGFRSLQNSFDEFKAEKSTKNSSTSTVSSRTSGSSARTNDIQQDMFEEVDAPEFSYDIKSVILPDSVLSDILNPNMQVLVGDTLLQITRIGTFVVSPSHIQDFQTYYNANSNSINFDASYVAAPGEVSLGDGAYQVAPGIIRQESGSPDPLSTTNSVTYIPVPTGLGGDSPTALVYNTSTVDDGFNKEVGFVFNDWAKRRFVFRTYKTDFNIWVISFHKVGIQGYVQREKKFLWVTYWGESYADKIVVGCDNMNLGRNGQKCT